MVEIKKMQVAQGTSGTSATPAPLAAKAPVEAATPTKTCTVVEFSDGGATVTYRVPADVWKRVRSRAFTRDLAEYCEEEILKRSFEAHVF